MAGAPNFHKQEEWDALFDRVAKLEKENADLRELLTLALVMSRACILDIMQMKDLKAKPEPIHKAISQFMEEHGLKCPENGVEINAENGVVFKYEEG